MHLLFSCLAVGFFLTHVMRSETAPPSRFVNAAGLQSGGIPQAMIKNDTDLGCIEDLIPFVGLKRTYIQALKRCAKERHTDQNPSPFVGRYSSKQWLLEWLQRNRDFKVELAYPHRRA